MLFRINAIFEILKIKESWKKNVSWFPQIYQEAQQFLTLTENTS